MAPAINFLSITGAGGNISPRVFLKFPTFKNVKSLTLSVGPNLTPMEWALVVELFPNLKEFDNGWTRYLHLTNRTLQLFARGWPNLTVVKIPNCIRLTGAGLINFFTVANRVQKIDINGIASLTDRHMDTITRLLGKSLKKINFGEDQYMLSGLTIKSLAQNCPQLTHICCVSHPMRIGHLKDLVHLRSLKINFSMRPSHCAELEEIFSRQFAQLRVLEIEAKNLTDSQLIQIANSCPSLTNLCLWMRDGNYNNRSITDLGVDQIVNECRNLTQLDIERFSLLTGRCFVGSRSKLPNLQILRLSECANLDEGAIRAEFAGVQGMTIELE